MYMIYAIRISIFRPQKKLATDRSPTLSENTIKPTEDAQMVMQSLN